MRFMSMIHHWFDEQDGLPEHRILLAALPGVGNVGKLVVDSLIEANQNQLILRLLHPAMPPQAKLDENGLLIPPAIEFHQLEDGLMVVTAEGQPMTPEGQHECATEILSLARGAGVEQVIVLAGMAAPAGDDDVFLVCSNSANRVNLEETGVDIRRDQPGGGVIGLAGLLSSMGPALGVNTSCAISTTVGASVDPVAADRLFQAIASWFSLNTSPLRTILERMATNRAILETKGVVGEFSDVGNDDSAPMLYS